MPSQTPKSYITVPRYITEDYLNKKITRNEFILCVWIRCNADIFGYTTTSVAAIRDDMFPNVEVNTVQKLVLSLRKKRYIYFPNHQGCRGSFRIESDNWLMKSKGTKSIANRFDQNEIITDDALSQQADAESRVDLNNQDQILNEQRMLLTESFSMDRQRSSFTSRHNENENENDHEKNTSLGSTLKRTLSTEFEPTNEGERRCKEIALEIGDEYINPLLAILRTPRGLWLIERAHEIFTQDRATGKRIGNLAAYFQGIIKRLRAK